MNIRRGLYRHYKGKDYEVLGTTRHSETLEEFVLYKALYGDQGLWVRPMEMFEGTVEVDGQEVPRFAYHDLRQYDTLLFDLDGTITDSQLGIINSVHYALDKFNIAEDDVVKLKKFIGPPLIDSFRNFYGFTESQAKQAVVYYREYFTVKGIYENSVYEGIPALLAELQRAGKRLILATSKPTIFSERILEYFDLQKYFSLVVGSNLDGTRINKAEIIQYILSEMPGKDKKSFLMIGDREHDCRGARECGIDCAAVLYGYGAPSELQAEGPTYLIGSVAELALLLGS